MHDCIGWISFHPISVTQIYPIAYLIETQDAGLYWLDQFSPVLCDPNISSSVTRFGPNRVAADMEGNGDFYF